MPGKTGIVYEIDPEGDFVFVGNLGGHGGDSFMVLAEPEAPDPRARMFWVYVG
ncbi:hypothetical protein L6R50_28060 [Myxococcota bacterium]|nr:hypothetical protein [Myxococcota bacterium]